MILSKDSVNGSFLLRYSDQSEVRNKPALLIGGYTTEEGGVLAYNVTHETLMRGMSDHYVRKYEVKKE